MLKEKTFYTGMVSLNYVEGPSLGPPILLLHGVPGTWQEFLPLFPALSMRWHVFALDLRGQGKSGRIPGHYLPGDYISDVKIFLKRQIAEPAVIFGNSASGIVALEVAGELPELVRALLIGDSPLDIDWLLGWMTSEEFRRYFSALRELAGSNQPVGELAQALADMPTMAPGVDKVGDLPGVDDAYLRSWARTVSRLDPDVLAYHSEGRAREFLGGFDLEKTLERVPCPVLLLQGSPELGALMSPRSVEYVHAFLQDVSHVLVESAGHDLGLSTWQVGPLLRAMMDFLESLIEE
jgi:pimeloyl-ACP methyl ester carboxylesterase